MNAIPHRVETSVKPEVTAFFDAPTNTISYVVKDPASAACAVVDSVMDIDYAAGRITHGSADAIRRSSPGQRGTHTRLTQSTSLTRMAIA